MTTNKQNEVREQFNAMLNKVLNFIEKSAKNQFEYNLETNIPQNIGGIVFDNAAEQAVKHGIVSGVNKWLSWDCDEAIKMAYSFLEDSNCHGEAKELAKFIPEYNN